MKYDVFISYSRKDIDEVKRFIDRLQVAIPSLTCWFDITGVESGDEFEEKIIDAIDNSSNLIFFLSENSISSKWTKDEVMYAKNTDKKVVPILLKNAKLKGWFLFKFGRIDCIDSTADEQVNKLIENLSIWTGKKVLRGNDSTKLSHQQIAQPSNSTTAKSFEEKAKIANEEAWVKWHAERQNAKNVTVAQKHNAKATNTSTKTYKIGDLYDKNGELGVVFEVSDDGKHGKIVGVKQSYLEWTSDANEQKRLIGANNLDNGEYNMSVVKQISNWRSKYPAFAWCADLGKGWYLPAREELLTIYRNKKVINHSLCAINAEGLKNYWSSTERDQFFAWLVYMKFSGTNFYGKYYTHSIRAVATF